MVNRLAYLIGSSLAMTALAAMLAMVAPQQANAQVDTCCVRIANHTDCPLTICVRLPSGEVRCVTVAANSPGEFRTPCNVDTRFAVRDSCDIDRLIPDDLDPDNCVRAKLRGGCCARVCLTRDDDGCIVITARQSPVDCTCP